MEDTCYLGLSPTQDSYPENIKNSYKLISKRQLVFFKFSTKLSKNLNR